MTITDSYSERSYLAGLTCNMDVRAHIGRSTGRSIPLVVASSGQEWQYDISTVRGHIGRSTGRYTPPVVASSCQEWQCEISTVRSWVDQLANLPPHTLKASWDVYYGMYLSAIVDS